MATVAQSPAEIKLTLSPSSLQETIPRLEPTTGYRTLGCYIAGSGSMTKAKGICRDHSETYAAHIHESHLGADEAYVTYMMFQLP